MRLVAALLALCAGLILAAKPDPSIFYTVRIPAPQSHYVEVEARVPTSGQSSVELMMAVWTPYVIREYAKNLEAVTARTVDGRPLAVAKSRKNRWRIETAGSDPIIVSYRVYCHVMHVQDDWVDGEFALLNGAPTYLTLADHIPRPHDVELKLPPEWKSSWTGMPAVAGKPDHYRAPDYETLVDSPIVAGNPVIHEFDVDGKQNYLVDVAENSSFDGKKAAHDLALVVHQDALLWGGLPYDKYLFLNMLTSRGGGMEHSNSTALMSNCCTTPRSYSRWLDTASHEFFHAWNVKRLRPAEFIPGEYETEPYTASLGVAEGFTTYYAPVLLHRAGVYTDDDLLDNLSHIIGELQATPGRLVQTLSMSSFDTWIKFYHPDENSVNTAISYYTKGAVVAFLLDAHVRSMTHGSKSLDDVMRLALERNPQSSGYTPAAFRAAASAVAGADLSAWFAETFDSTAELDYHEALDWFGLRFAPPSAIVRVWLGADTRNDDGRLVITRIPRGSPAYDAGLDTGDEIAGCDDLRVEAAEWDHQLARYHPGDQVTLRVVRRGKTLPIAVTLGREPEHWTLEVAVPSSPRRATW